MATRKLEKSEWQPYFDRVTRSLGATQVTIEVASLRIGDQLAVDHVPLNGILYDPKSDALEVVTDAVDHMIRKPAEIYVEESGSGMASLEVVEGDGTKQIVMLSAPLLIADHAV